MKRVLFLMFALAVSVVSFAQSHEKLAKKLNSAIETSNNPKKATKYATWFNLGEAYVNAFRAPSKDVWPGMPMDQVKMIWGSQRVVSNEQREVQGVPFFVDIYEDKEAYYNQAGVLEMVVVTKPVAEGDLLQLAFEAYMKAYELDTKGSKREDLAEAAQKLKDDAMNDAVTAYMLGNFSDASEKFEKTAIIGESPLLNAVDAMAIYNAALTAQFAGELERAIRLFDRCIELGNVQEGAIYANQAEILKQLNRVDEAKALLNKGFQEYPGNQSILVSLINLYIDSNDDPNKILELIRAAQANEPENASLYYAEGNVYLNMKDYQNAIACYNKSFEVDPTYLFGIYSVGNTYFEMAIDAQNRMDALDFSDVKGYEAVSQEFESYLQQAIKPFETAFSLATTLDFQYPIADGLKQIYFRFRDKGEEYAAGYEKYNKFLQDNQAAFEAL